MLGFTKQVFIVLLATKCISLNDEPCLARPDIFDVNPNELYFFHLWSV